jgi:hypothetical protein
MGKTNDAHECQKLARAEWADEIAFGCQRNRAQPFNSVAVDPNYN